MRKIAQPNFRLEQTITDNQLEFFRKYGILQFRNFIDKETRDVFITEISKVETFLLESGITKVNGIPLKFGKNTDGADLIQRIAFASHYSKTLQQFLQDPRLQLLLKLLHPYEGRIGENEKDGLVVNHYVNSEASQFKQLGWHTDSPRDLFLGSRIRPMLNVGLHLDDCQFENGGLRVLPGTHDQNIFAMLFRKKYFIDNRPDKKEVGFDIAAGDLTVHDGRLWHRVQQSPHTGELSRRRVMYIPIITGEYKPKHSKSVTPFYHKLAQLRTKPLTGKLKLADLAMRRASRID